MAAVHWIVVTTLLRQVALGDPAVRVVVRVLVGFPVAELLRPRLVMRSRTVWRWTAVVIFTLFVSFRFR